MTDPNREVYYSVPQTGLILERIRLLENVVHCLDKRVEHLELENERRFKEMQACIEVLKKL